MVAGGRGEEGQREGGIRHAPRSHALGRRAHISVWIYVGLRKDGLSPIDIRSP